MNLQRGLYEKKFEYFSGAGQLFWDCGNVLKSESLTFLTFFIRLKNLTVAMEMPSLFY